MSKENQLEPLSQKQDATSVISASVFDELSSVDQCSATFMHYSQSPAVIAAQAQSLTLPRLVFSSDAGTCLNIWPAGAGRFNLHISFETADADNGRFQHLFEDLSLDNILLLLADDWTEVALLQRWQPA